MESLNTFLRAQFDPLQYAAFFGTLVVLIGLELIVERSQESPVRRVRWPFNFGLTVLNIMILGAIPVSGVAVADFAQTQGYGLLNIFSVIPVFALVIGILLRSFVSWVIHLAMHKIPLLWRVHRVHHTDTFIDASTTVRFHPLEFLINTPFLLGAVLLFGISPVALMVYEIFDAVMAVFGHANIRLSKTTNKVVGAVLITPDMHRIHHSSYQPETDSNYGATFSFWDRLFGTYTEKEPEQLAKMQLGLKECQDEKATSFLWQLALPTKAIKIES